MRSLSPKHNLVQRLGQQPSKQSRSPPLYQDRQKLLSALRDAFQRKDVDFYGGYTMIRHPAVSDKHCIRMITNEIWEHTGYRFTVKDHPRIKNGQKTRLWCSQDAAHSRKPKHGQAARSKSSPSSDDGGLVGKARYPCHSHLTISSQEAALQGHCLITIRMRHHDKHEPYSDSSMPSEALRALWEGLATPVPIGYPTPWVRMETQSLSENEGSRLASVGEGSHSRSVGIRDGEEDEERQDVDEVESDVELEYPEPETDTRAKFQERMRSHIHNIRDFCDGLEYQLQFNDLRMLESLENEGASFLRLVHDCLQQEGRV